MTQPAQILLSVQILSLIQIQIIHILPKRAVLPKRNCTRSQEVRNLELNPKPRIKSDFRKNGPMQTYSLNMLIKVYHLQIYLFLC